jgi:RNA polymerase sigma factor (sigma-70 family)
MSEKNLKIPQLEQNQLATWLAGVARQDKAAFRALYDGSSTKLFGFALRILIKHEWAEEVLQESYVSIWNSASGYQSGLALPMTWMTTIVRNKAFDYLRKMRQEGTTIEIDAESYEDGGMGSVLETMASSDAGPGDVLQMTQDAHALAHCFSQLQGLHRQAIALAYYHDQSHSEIAEQLKQPIGSIKTWIRRGLERLRGCLTKMEGV